MPEKKSRQSLRTGVGVPTYVFCSASAYLASGYTYHNCKTHKKYVSDNFCGKSYFGIWPSRPDLALKARCGLEGQTKARSENRGPTASLRTARARGPCLMITKEPHSTIALLLARPRPILVAAPWPISPRWARRRSNS